MKYELHKCGNCNRKISQGHRVDDKPASICNACYKKLGYKSWLDGVIKLESESEVLAMNKQNEVTKGEWKVEQTQFGDYLIVAHDGLKHSAVADVAHNNDNAEANAYLIAAVPDMVKALKLLTDRVSKSHDKELFGAYTIASELLASIEGR